MLKNTLSTWDKKKLRLVLVLFFFALAIPTAILIQQAYSQLKWEAFHHYRLQAEELTKRIDARFIELIEIESARSFTDYSFLNVAGTEKSNVLQRSPLSAFPLNSQFPGIIGYFQVDNFGQFTSPLLPLGLAEQYSNNEHYTIAQAEKIKRQRVHNKIHLILGKNKLINKPATPIAKKPTYVPLSPLAEEKSAVGLSSPKEVQRQQPKPKISKIFEVENDNKRQDWGDRSVAEKITANDVDSLEIMPQAAFDNLQSKQNYSLESEANVSGKGGRVENLNLKKDFQAKLNKSKKQRLKSAEKKEQVKRTLRKESNILPEYPTSVIKSKSKLAEKETRLRVNMFESEIDSFEFSQLESGHLVLYRKVWRNGKRYIQGLLIEQKKFINDVIQPSFYNTNVSSASNLTIAYQGNILSTLLRRSSRDQYSSRKLSSNQNLQGTLLLQSKLSNTLDKIELIYSVNNLPAGPGGIVINWLSLILFLILCGGFLILYILGLKQIKLARQQQDFVSAVSHELKTPLTSIRMYGEMLREGWTTEEKRKQYYDYIYDESERLTRLINNVLQLARMTRNELPVDLKPYTISELISTIHSKISSQVDNAKFTLNLNYDENCKEKKILVDADYFIQIIINLVDNAIKFSAKSEKQQIDIRCHVLRNNKIQFTIRDYGPGVDKDQLRKIFQLFYRTENELTRETVGTGIGLSLVNQLVSSMQAKIDVVNKDPGIEFQITFQLI